LERTEQHTRNGFADFYKYIIVTNTTILFTFAIYYHDFLLSRDTHDLHISEITMNNEQWCSIWCWNVKTIKNVDIECLKTKKSFIFDNVKLVNVLDNDKPLLQIFRKDNKDKH